MHRATTSQTPCRGRMLLLCLLFGALAAASGCTKECDQADMGCPDGGTCKKPDARVCPGGDGRSCGKDAALLPCEQGTCKPCPDGGAKLDKGLPVGDAGPSPDLGPVTTLPDDTFAHLSAGTLSEGGAKIYVSRHTSTTGTDDGKVRLVDWMDVNGDGDIDLFFSNRTDGTTYKLNSQLYAGSKKGFSSSVTANETLLTSGAEGAVLCDLDADDNLDLVVANAYDGTSYSLSSYVYKGTSASPSFTTAPETYATIRASDVAVADLDKDGYLDLVFANNYDGTGYQLNSYVYYGSSTTTSKKTELPTVGARAVAIADLDKDGDLDLVFANSTDGTSSKVNSYVYYNSTTGFGSPALLPTVGAYGVSVADFNADGYPDIVFSNYSDGTSNAQNAYIYWGSSSAFGPTSTRQELPGLGASGNAVGDFDGDGYLDLALANYTNGSSMAINSYIYWNGKKGFNSKVRQELPTKGAMGVLAADLNKDGTLDLAFSNSGDGTTYKVNAYVYWGSTSGLSSGNRTELPVVGAGHGLTTDIGATADRKLEQTFTSRVMVTPSNMSPHYLTLAWKAVVGTGCSIRFQLRTGKSDTAAKSAVWYGPTSTTDYYEATSATSEQWINPIHRGERYIQYRAVFSSDLSCMPVLDATYIKYR